MYKQCDDHFSQFPMQCPLCVCTVYSRYRNPRRWMFRASAKSRFAIEINEGLICLHCSSCLWDKFVDIHICAIVLLPYMQIEYWEDSRNAHAFLALCPRDARTFNEDEAKGSTAEQGKSINSENEIKRNNKTVTRKSDLVREAEANERGRHRDREWEIRAFRRHIACSYFNCASHFIFLRSVAAARTTRSRANHVVIDTAA